MTNNLQCNHCDKEFKYESERKRHEFSHSPHFKCGVCNKKFSFSSALKRHEKQHQRTEKALCKQCGRSFRDESLLKRHIKYAHKGKFTCIKCNAEFHSEVALSVHEKRHKPKSERKYHCSYAGCEKTFNFPHHLKHHEMTHTDTKQYYCHICRKGFIQFHHLKSHVKIHEPENWVHCTEINCKKSFPNEYSKKRHLLQVHNIKLNDTSTAESSHTDTDFKYNIEVDTVLCTTCGKIMDLLTHEEHRLKCAPALNEYTEDLSDSKLETRERKQIINDDNSSHINDCKSVLGSCIVSGDSSENCLCAQIKTTVDDYYDSNIIPDENINSTKSLLCESYNPTDNGTINARQTNLQQYNNEFMNSGCESCACGGNLQTNIGAVNDNCLNTSQQNCPQNNIKINLPDIEYKIDGSIKLKYTFDPDIKVFKNDNAENKENKEAELYNSYYVPFNSCKAVLGKCIVSGNGTISEECLCARMLVDEQQVTAEEIDEITPHPTVSSMNLSVI